VTVSASGSSNSAPAIDTFDVTDESTDAQGNDKKNVKYSVDWEVSDADDNLNSLTLRLNDKDGNEVDSANPTVSGGVASGTTTLEDPKTCNNNNQCSGYQIEIVVTDTDDASDSESQTDTADGDNPSLSPIQWDPELTD
jgi:hypothetical protein